MTENFKYKDGPLKGQFTCTVLISAEATTWLEHAAEETGCSLPQLVEISAEEAALAHAKAHKLLDLNRRAR